MANLLVQYHERVKTVLFLKRKESQDVDLNY